MRYHEVIVEAAVDTGILRQAAYDFLNDWRQVPEGEEDNEPEPRRSFIVALRQEGFTEASPDDDVMAALIRLMRPEANRFLQALPWQNGKLTVYRNISVPEGWERNAVEGSRLYGGGLGVFWATTETWGGNTTIVSQVRANQINWHIVILKHLTYSENEIRIKDNQKVPILRVYRWDNGKVIEKDVRHLAGKLFSVGERSDDWPD
jgi:hypothetical protein